MFWERLREEGTDGWVGWLHICDFSAGQVECVCVRVRVCVLFACCAGLDSASTERSGAGNILFLCGRWGGEDGVQDLTF